MQTSLQWWDVIKASPDNINSWLEKQYHGELTSVQRLNSFVEVYGAGATEEQLKTISIITSQENRHAGWIEDLLSARGIDAKVLDKKDRYWDKAIPYVSSFQSGCAIAAHAEEMRLERIKVISDDQDAPEDIRSVFRAILKEETFHAQAFLEMAGEEAFNAANQKHAEALEAIGLII